jgi:hypothetical protein
MRTVRRLIPSRAMLVAVAALTLAAAGLVTGAAIGSGTPTFTVRTGDGVNYVEVHCPPGETATGGGVNGYGPLELSHPLRNHAGHPTGWIGRGARSQDIRTFVVCESP